MRYTVGWPEIKKMVAGGDFHAQKISSLSYLLWVLSPEFSYTSHGLFLTDFDRRFNPVKYTQQYGRFKAEGMINQIQLNKVTKNRVAQFEIGCRAARAWIHQLKSLPCRKSAIYLTGETSYSLAVFSKPRTADILSLNKKIATQEKLTRREAPEFVKWAL